MFESLKKVFGIKPKDIPLPDKAEELVGDSGRKISEKDLDELLWELELGLLEADVALPVIEEIKASVRESLLGKRVDRKFTVEDAIKLALMNADRVRAQAERVRF